MSRPFHVAAALALLGFSPLLLSATALADSGDAALTCPQITSQIDAQNVVVKRAAHIRRLHANDDEGTAASPDVTQANSDAADASARAQTLLALGRSKKCFR